jgi:hypothetical protein
MAKAVAGVPNAVLSNPVVVLTDSQDAPVTLPDPPTISGTVVTQIVPGSLLSPQQYQLVLTVQADEAGDTILSAVLQINVPF